LLALLAGCSKPETSAPPPLPPQPPTIQVRDIPDFPVRVMLNGKEVGSFDRYRGGEYAFNSDAEIKLAAPAESQAVAAQGLHPDGWKDGVAEIFQDAVKPIIWVQFKAPETWKTKIGLQVDNRGGELAEVFVGQMPRTIKANEKGKLFYPAPSAAKGAAVTIHGNEVGTLWPADQKDEPDWDKEKFFVDVTGKRSYEYREVYYSSRGVSATEAELLNLKPARGSLSPGYLHRVPFSFSFLLERAPNEIQVQSSLSEPFAVRTEILER